MTIAIHINKHRAANPINIVDISGLSGYVIRAITLHDVSPTSIIPMPLSGSYVFISLDISALHDGVDRFLFYSFPHICILN